MYTCISNIVVKPIELLGLLEGTCREVVQKTLSQGRTAETGEE
jgi:hypothetical protein